MIRQHANPAQSQIDQNLRADAAFALHQALTSQILIELAALVKADLRQPLAFVHARIDLKSAAGVMQVDEHAAPRLSNRAERPLDNRVAIARDRTEHVASQA